MAVLSIIITTPTNTTSQLNVKSQFPTLPKTELNALIDLLGAIAGGNLPASIQVVSRGTDPGVTTDADPHSVSNTYSNL